MAIRFELFSDSDAKQLQKRVEGFMLVNKVGRQDIIKMDNSPIVNGSFIHNIITLVYDDNKSPFLTEDEQRLQDALNKKHSGPRRGPGGGPGPKKGVKRGPYKKTRERAMDELHKKKQTIDLHSTNVAWCHAGKCSICGPKKEADISPPQNKTRDVTEQIRKQGGPILIKKGDKAEITEIPGPKIDKGEPLRIVSEAFGVKNQNKEKEYYEGMDMVVVPPQKPVEDTD